MREFLNSNGIEVRENSLANPKAKAVFDYLKAVAETNKLGKEVDKQGILAKQHSDISSLDKGLAISPYIDPKHTNIKALRMPTLIYPFGCNASQKKAVEEAFCNQLSVIHPLERMKTRRLSSKISQAYLPIWHHGDARSKSASNRQQAP